jgi:nucleoside-diphosphate-sugar epimerase
LVEYRRVNVDGTLNLARQAAEAGVSRFVFVSSIKVNGEETGEGMRFTADQLPAPEDAYGISKLEAEQALRALAEETGMEVVIIRPPLVYGAGVKGNFATMIVSAIKPTHLP